MKKPRHLSKEERELWDKIARTAEPIERETPAPGVSQAPRRKPSAKSAVPLAPFKIGAKSPAPASSQTSFPGIAERLGAAPLNMDAKAFGRMKRGKISPDGRIDLHGMTVAEAHRELIEYILDANAAGKRLVLVITGKGRTQNQNETFPVSRGVLRHQVPQWLTLPPLRNIILQVTPANRRHGGDGAYYVYLKRPR